MEAKNWRQDTVMASNVLSHVDGMMEYLLFPLTPLSRIQMTNEENREMMICIDTEY